MITAASIIKNLPSAIRAACRKTTASLESSSPPACRFAFQRSVVKTLLVSFFALIFLFLLATQASAKTWYIKVDGTGDAPTIQAGIDSAAVGDTVLVGPGIYSDTLQIMIDNEPKVVNVHMYKNIKLVAEGNPLNTRIDGSNSDIAIYVENVDSTACIGGFNIRTQSWGVICLLPEDSSPAQEDWEPVGIRCRSSSLIITQNTFNDNFTGIELFKSSAKILGNEIINSGRGIWCRDSSEADIRQNRISEAVELIICWHSNATICDNDLFWGSEPSAFSCYGISCLQASPYISGNHIVGMVNAGIGCNGGNPVIEDNQLEWSFANIELQGTPFAVIRRNVVLEGTIGIDMLGVSGGVIENNTIIGSGIVAEVSYPLIRNNIVYKGTIWCFGSSLALECNNVFIPSRPITEICTVPIGTNGNISADPQFCGIEGSGNYYLQDDSPCAPGNHPDGYDCGLIGTFGVSCGIDPVTQKTWGIIKSLYEGTTL
ncbi:MAG: hypothetical protein GTO29_11955, partial [Candidatus Latescibacteria bacterium]|nr:hypothetical protein [Candidatus Latescibacterota bacterium]NIO56878.1 hypothetical protein [Candidatus Latescibacterota bacterium]